MCELALHACMYQTLWQAIRFIIAVQYIQKELFDYTDLCTSNRSIYSSKRSIYCTIKYIDLAMHRIDRFIQ